MVKKIIENGVYNTKIDQYLIETDTEVAQLPTNVNMGSIAFCIGNKKFYIINSSHQWVEI